MNKKLWFGLAVLVAVGIVAYNVKKELDEIDIALDFIN